MPIMYIHIFFESVSVFFLIFCLDVKALQVYAMYVTCFKVQSLQRMPYRVFGKQLDLTKPVTTFLLVFGFRAWLWSTITRLRVLLALSWD